MMDCMRARHKTPLKIFPDNFISTSGGRVLKLAPQWSGFTGAGYYSLDTKSSQPAASQLPVLESGLTMKYVNVFVSTLNTSSE